PPYELAASWPFPSPNPSTRGPVLLLLPLVFTTLTLLTLSLRLYVRLRLIKCLYREDHLIVLAGLGAVGLGAVVAHAHTVGWDRHQWDQRLEWFEASELDMWLVQLFFIVIMAFVKLSTLALYGRMTVGISIPYYKIVNRGMILVMIGWGVGFFTATVFGCWPIEMYWKSRSGDECTNEYVRLAVGTIVNIVTDFVVVLMPLPIIWKLQRPMREKIILWILMAVGLIHVRSDVQLRYHLFVPPPLSPTSLLTTPGLGGLAFAYTVVECNLAIMCTSIPTLRPLAKKYMPKL
ncbi:hypothetical protein P152DRAFT_363961, partial [Eremomyces bilateralis CBS 781.70]